MLDPRKSADPAPATTDPASSAPVSGATPARPSADPGRSATKPARPSPRPRRSPHHPGALLVHICCSVDSFYFIEELRKLYPAELIVGFFYDPNIHPFSEYELRFMDVSRACARQKIRLYRGEYEFERWLAAVKGYENEPERGARCELCFDFRMQGAVDFARAIGATRLTTTLLTSPKKDLAQLGRALQKECDPHGIEFLAPDFRKNGGTQRQFALAKKAGLYHQNYCGCIYGLAQQRTGRAFIDELLSPANGQVLPGSIEERLVLYKKIRRLEEAGRPFVLRREKFLNYRLLKGLVNFTPAGGETQVLACQILFYSHFKNAYTRFSLAQAELRGGVYHSVKDELSFVEFERFNEDHRGRWADFADFLRRPLKISQEVKWRQRNLGAYNLSPILVMEKIRPGRYEIAAKSEIYFDVRELLRAGI